MTEKRSRGGENARTGVKLTVEQYLRKVATFAGNDFGGRFRSQFRDRRGTSELAMLACPSLDELEQLRRAVAIMTAAEKQNTAFLTDEQVATIARDADADAGILAIFFNGYALECKRVSAGSSGPKAENSS